jgi:probable F420-dependent oxidoreductase
VKNDNSRQWAFLLPVVPGEALAEQARQVEAAGMAGIFFAQFYSSPFMGLGFCAAVTQRVKLGSGIAVAFTRSPFETAMTAIDLDRVCDGRLILGLGTSVREWVEGIYGEPNYGKPVAHMREVIEVIRRIVREAHTGGLDRYDGTYVKHDWSTFQGALAPPVRESIPIWIAANQKGLTRLAGEVADGFIDHPIHGRHWIANAGRDALHEGLRRAGRERRDVHWNTWLAVAVNKDKREAIEDCRAYVAFYAGVRQYEPMFAADGFAEQARACQQAIERRDMAAAAAAVTDEMVEHYVIVGPADECRRKLDAVWDIPNSFCLVPPHDIEPEKLAFYLGGIAETFYT